MADRALERCRILVVEDEYYLAEELTLELENKGAVVVGPVSNLDGGFALLGEQVPHGAVLDINLGGVPAFPLADALIERGVPLVFTTGYDPRSLPERYAHVAKCEKPLNVSRVSAALRQAIHP